MKLSQVVEEGVSVHLVCKACGAHQPAYPQAMLDRHGPNVELDIALALYRCIFCEGRGQFTAMVIAAS